MFPNILIAHMMVPNWFLMVGIGAVAAIALGVYCVPKNFVLKRFDTAFLGILLIAAGLAGGRTLFNILHYDGKIKGGFAYFGALILSIAVIWLYSAAKKVKFIELADYSAPFLFLSQAFVRIGCLMAGCCYGKPTHSSYGAIFKAVDKVLRHPTQAYEAILLFFIFLAGRYIYSKRSKMAGYTFFFSLAAYGIGRFLIEYLRVDSPVLFLNLTLAQVTCLALAAISLIAMRYSSVK